MSRRKPIDAKILEASREFDACVFAETVKGKLRISLIIDESKTCLISCLVSESYRSLWLFLWLQYY